MQKLILILYCCLACARLQAQTQNSIKMIGLGWQPSFRLDKPLCFLNGKKFSSDSLHLLNPNSIESIDVIKGLEAQKKYGDEGKNGVLLVQSKDIARTKED